MRHICLRPTPQGYFLTRKHTTQKVTAHRSTKQTVLVLQARMNIDGRTVHAQCTRLNGHTWQSRL
jgi:hypothetical protein